MDIDLFNKCKDLLYKGDFINLRDILFNEKNKEIHNDPTLNIVRGIFYLNVKEYLKASNILWDTYLIEPYNTLIQSNINLLPYHYKNKFMKIYIDYDNEIALKFINNFLLNKNIILFVDRDNYNKLNNENINIYNDENIDLCLRIKNKTTFEIHNKSLKTLILILNESDIENIDNIYNNKLYLMTFKNQKNEKLNEYRNILTDDILNFIDDGIDYTKHKILNEYEKNKMKNDIGIDNETVFMTNDNNLDIIIENFDKVYLFTKKIKLIIVSDNNEYNNLDYVININKKTNELYNIIDCYITFENDELLVESYGKNIINKKDNLLENIIDIIEENKINYENIGYYYNNYNFKDTVDDIIDGYLYGPLYLNILRKCINTNINSILQHNDRDLEIIKKLLIKMLDYKNIYIRFDIDILKLMINLNYYVEMFNIKKYKSNNIIKNIIYNNYQFILDYKINNIYKSLLIDYVMKSIETISRKENIYNNILNLLDNYNFENYYCMLPNTYFLSTYITQETSKKCKSLINRNIQKGFRLNNISVKSNPIKIDNKYTIAIVGVTGDFNGNAVYKFIRQQIISLSKYFNIHLLVEDALNDDIEINDELKPYINKIYSIKIENDVNNFNNFYNGNFDISTKINNFNLLKENNYLMCYFLVMGCSISSIYLSNLKIAPYQMSGYGHPISSFGSKNNYFIMSSDIEDVEYINKNYTEQPLFVNKLTTNPITPSFDLINIDKKDNHICLSCTFKKLTPQFMKMLNDVSIIWNKNNNNKLVYHFFTGPCGYLIDSTTLLDGCVKNENYEYVMEYSTKSFDNYMSVKGMCYLAFDSYPYAGFTTILENLRLKLPTIVYEGNEVVNRFPSYFYKNMNLEELIVKSYDEYIDLAIKLLTDKDFYNKIKNKIDNINVDDYLKDIYDEESLINSFLHLVDDFEKNH